MSKRSTLAGGPCDGDTADKPNSTERAQGYSHAICKTLGNFKVALYVWKSDMKYHYVTTIEAKTEQELLQKVEELRL